MNNRWMFVYLALIVAPSFAAPAQDEATRRIQERFVAPCCWQENLAFHQSPAADEMRGEVSQLVQSGKSEEQIVEYYVARYGERILREPRGSLGVWLRVMPFAVLAGGGLLLAGFLRRVTAGSRPSFSSSAGGVSATDDDGDW